MPDELEALRRAIRRRFGTKAGIENVVVPTLGGSNRTIAFDVVDGTARRRLVSRQQTYAGEGNPFVTFADQFRVMRIVFRHGFPAPEPLFEFDVEDDMGTGYVMAYVEGETMPQRILRDPSFVDARRRLTAQCGELLALLHSIDVRELEFLEHYPDSVDPVSTCRDRLETYAEPHPAVELGLRWLERHRPASRPRQLVHGDFRTGNLIVGPDGIRAVLDYECSHVGAGVEDIGWLCTRSWRFGAFDHPVGGFGERAPLLAAYQAAGGTGIDPADVRYWEIFGLVRWAILNIWQGYGHVFGGRRSAVYAACGRNVAMMEYDLLMTLASHYD